MAPDSGPQYQTCCHEILSVTTIKDTTKQEGKVLNNVTSDLVKSKNENATGSLPVGLKCFKQEENYHNNIKKK